MNDVNCKHVWGYLLHRWFYEEQVEVIIEWCELCGAVVGNENWWIGNEKYEIKGGFFPIKFPKANQ